jgi:hypothetical protein
MSAIGNGAPTPAATHADTPATNVYARGSVVTKHGDRQPERGALAGHRDRRGISAPMKIGRRGSESRSRALLKTKP